MVDFGFIVSKNKIITHTFKRIIKELSVQRIEKYLLLTLDELSLVDLTAKGILINQMDEVSFEGPVPEVILNTVVFRKSKNKKIMKQLRMEEKITLINPINKIYPAKIYEILRYSELYDKYLLERLNSESITNCIAVSQKDSYAPWFYFSKNHKDSYLIVKNNYKSIIDKDAQKKLFYNLIKKKYAYYKIDATYKELEFKRIYCQKRGMRDWLIYDSEGRTMEEKDVVELLNYLMWYLPGLANCYMDFAYIPKTKQFYLINISGWDFRIFNKKRIAKLYLETAISYLAFRRREINHETIQY
ncbi:hypothetical protein SAMN02745885_01362 [Carboxydocella sporoproducens DSM 16521]|uniref:Uncharacterized protein n=2 Tax=Carboxydocella TaxID=178898 RepID=A0A1T4PQM0_9FIRM|nr:MULTISPECIES: hypothetical protein [Carboxydocella]AVX19699.1 hypothetical protein CFE_0500 [Carboxydocella thermautotrophica]SJZ93709.1 hypothetical protein SAMN02745885_01362 [Carboxydocella sporoproducens DSM 16521]